MNLHAKNHRGRTSRRWPSLLGVALALAAIGCGGAVGPATLDSNNEQCAYCRMAVSNARLAAQIVAPSEEPKFFDDIGCMRDYLAKGATLPPGSLAFVADHRTGTWIAASTAVYVKNEEIKTPMGSSIIAHADAASREADPASTGGTPMTAADVFGPAGPPRGTP